jgi:hypothetical protein
VLVFDPSAFPKKGAASVGVQRQGCGRLGKVDNGQVGVFLGSVGDADHALVDFRLDLPREWAKDRKRRKKAGVPKDVQYPTRHELALAMLRRRGGGLPHGWVAGDDEMGRPAWFRKRLADDKERYLLAVPSNTTIRDLEEPPPAYGGRGRRPKAPFRGVRAWCESLPAGAWAKPGPAHTFLLMEKALRNQAETPKTALISGVRARRRPGRAANAGRPAHPPHRCKTLGFVLARGGQSSEVL